MALIIKNGIIVTSRESLKQDIKIENGKITELGTIKAGQEDTIYDAQGSYLLPGGVDAHTHLDLDTGVTKTADDFYTGTKAAIAGGTTTIIDFATQTKGRSLTEAVSEWHEKAATGTFCDYGFHMAIIDWNEKISEEMQKMMDMGITSFKMYMAYKGILQVDDGIILEALERSAQVGGLIGLHCENGDLVVKMTEQLLKQGKTTPFYHQLSRPDILEEEAIFRLCEIAKLAKSPVWVVHLSCEKGLKVIESMKKQGVEVVTETCPQYLLLDNSSYGTEGGTDFSVAKYSISPPLRKKADINSLWEGIKNGAVDFISTDHCSFNLKNQKELGIGNFSKIPNGGPGLEHRVMLMYHYGVVENKISINDMVRLLSEKPSEVFGLCNKGKLEVGRDADIVVINPSGKTMISAQTQYQNVDYTPYEGFELNGAIEKVYLRGQEVIDGGKFCQNTPLGQFQKREKGKW